MFLPTRNERLLFILQLYALSPDTFIRFSLLKLHAKIDLGTRKFSYWNYWFRCY